MYMPDALRALVDLSSAPREKLRHRMYNIAAMSPRADEIAAVVAKRIPARGSRSRATRCARPSSTRGRRPSTTPRRARTGAGSPRYDLEAMSDELIAAVRAMPAPAGSRAHGAPAAATPVAAAPAPARRRRARKPAATKPASAPKPPAPKSIAAKPAAARPAAAAPAPRPAPAAPGKKKR